MNHSLQKSVVFFLFLCTVYSCQNSTDKAKASTVDQKLESNQAEMPDLNEFKKVETKEIDKAPANTKAEVKKTVTEPKVKSETLVKAKPKTEKPIPKKQAPKKPKVKAKPAILFEEPVYDFGEITEGDIIKHKFKFKNTGNADLVIKSAHASCGCTDPSYPFMATPPGEEGYIGMTYNSVSKDGPQKPEVTIQTNADNNSFILYLTGNVVPKEKEDSEKSDSTEVKKKN